MADNRENLSIHVDTSVSGDDLVTALTAKMKALEAQAKRINDSFKDIGRVSSSTPGGSNAKSELAAENVRAKSRRSKAKADTDSLNAAARINFFDKESAKFFRTKIQSQRVATAEAMKAEKQSYSDFRTKAAFRDKYESSQVKALKSRLTAERNISAMRAKAEGEVVRQLQKKLGVQSQLESSRAREASKAQRDQVKSDQAQVRSVRQLIGSRSRMAAQRVAEERASAREKNRSIAEAARAETTRMREQASAIRSNARLESSEMRRVERERSSARRTFSSSSREAMSKGSDAYHRITRPPAVAAAVGTAATVGFGRKALGAEADIDAAEINSRIYAGLSKEAARELRDKWASPLAESLGVNTSKMITSFTDAVKLGIPTEGAKQFSELATKTSEAWGVPFENVTDILGTVNTLLTSNGEAFNYDKLKSTANTLQYLAAKQSTTPEKLMSFMQRGAGAAQVLGMSQEAGLAFGSASTSLGNQAGQSGRMFDYVASRLIEMPRLTKKKGDEGKQARDLIRSLGYSSAEDMDRNRRASPDKFLPDFMERFSKIQNPKKQEEAIRFFTGREWMGEFGRMVKGNSTYKEAAKLAEEAKGLDAIGEVWELHRTKLSFVFKQFKAGWLNILGEFGKVLSPLARQAGDYFLEWSRKLQSGGLQARFRAAIDGLIEGFGFKDLPDMLKGMFGVPGEGEAGTVEKWKATAKAFAEGLSDVFGAIKGIASAISGGDPEVIARWTGRILALSAALLVLSPVLSVIGGLATAVLALAAAAKAGSALLRLPGIGAPATATAGATGAGAAGAAARVAGGGLVAMLSRFFILGLVAEIGANRVEISAMLTAPIRAYRDKIWESIKTGFTEGFDGQEIRKFFHDAFKSIKDSLIEEFVPAPVRRYLDSKEAEKTPEQKAEEKKVEDAKNGAGLTLLQKMGITSVPTAVKKTFEPLVPRIAPNSPAVTGTYRQFNAELGPTPTLDPRPAMESLKEAVNDNTLIHKQNFEKQTAFGGLIHKASISSPAEAVKSSLAGSSADIRSSSAVLSGSTSSGVMTGGPLSSSTPGERMNGGGGLGYKGIIGGAMSGRGAGPGGGGNLGSGVTPPMLKGDAAANAKTAFDFFKSKGLSTEAASGILASIKQESNFTPQARGDGGKAHGIFQHHPDRRAAIQRATGINMSTAGLQQQLEGAWWEMQNGDAGAQRALRILRQPGISARDAGGAFVQHFERPARDERASRGAMAEGFARQFGGGGAGASSGGVAASLGASAGQYDGLRVKGGQAIAGGNAYAGVTDLARQVQDSLPGGVKHFSAFNDRFHQGRRSKHNQGLAFDTSLIDGSKSAEAAEAMRNKMRSAGLTDKDFRVIDEYKNPSPHSTGGHIHSQFNNAEAAKKYSDYVATLKKPVQDMVAMQGELVRSSGWKPQSPVSTVSPIQGNFGGITDKADAIKGSSWKPFDGKPTASIAEGVEAGKPNLTDKLPGRNADAPGGVPVAGGGGGNTSNSSSVHAPITVNSSGGDAEAISNSIQRKLQEAMGRRTHDINFG